MKITYYASSNNMGDTSENECEKFRQWALQQLKSQYSEHDVIVKNEENFSECQTDDFENSDSITDFCHGLWDDYSNRINNV